MSQTYEPSGPPWSIQSAIPSTLRRLGGSLRRQLALLLKAPASATFVVLMWVAAIATHSIFRGPHPELLTRVGASLPALEHKRILTLLTSAFWTPGLTAYVFVSAAFLTAGAAIERRWGRLRFAAVTLSSQVIGVAFAISIVAGADALDGSWSPQLVNSAAVGPGAMLSGIILAFTASIGALWRRRIRLGMLATLLTLVLYGGLLQDVIRLSGALVGLTIGLLVVKRPPMPVSLRSTRRETRVLVAIVLAATAAGSLMAALTTTAVGPLAVLQYWFTSSAPDPTTLHSICTDPASTDMCTDLRLQFRFSGVGPSLLAVMPAILVIALADGLRRGRQFAWRCAIALHLFLAIAGIWLAYVAVLSPSQGAGLFALVSRNSIVGIAVPLLEPFLGLMLLVFTRRAFDVAAPRGTYARFGALLALTASVLLIVFVLGGLVLGNQFVPRPSVMSLLSEFPQRLIPPGYLGLVEMNFAPNSAAATFLFEWVGVIFWTVALAGIVKSFAHADAKVFDDDSIRAQQILRRHGSSPLSYMTSWRGNSYWFTVTGSSYVAYRVKGRVAVTTGGPVGPEDEIEAAISEFVAFCERNSWTPCLYGVTEEVREFTKRLGWPGLLVAQDTMLPLEDVAFSGKKFQDIRTALNRAERIGIKAVSVHYSHDSRSISDQIDAISEEWIAQKALPEMEFTLGTLDEVDDPEVKCFVAIDGDGVVHGVTSWLPAYCNGTVVGWTLDFMRRRNEAFGGVMDFLIASAALEFQREGVQFISLSATPFVESERASTILEKALETISLAIEPGYGFRSLFKFKSKFQPQYRPLFLVYPETAALPRVATAVYRSYLPRLRARETWRMAHGFATTRLRAATPSLHNDVEPSDRDRGQPRRGPRRPGLVRSPG